MFRELYTVLQQRTRAIGSFQKGGRRTNTSPFLKGDVPSCIIHYLRLPLMDIELKLRGQPSG